MSAAVSARRMLPADILSALEASGLEWFITPKAKHNQLVIDGRAVLTLPRKPGTGGCRQALNASACVRRFLREHAH